MPSELFLVLTLAFILFLFRRESRYRRKVSAALWIPLIWFLIAGSRFVSAWFDPRPASYRAAIEDGSPIDATVFLCLILSGIYVLKQRHVTIAKFFRSNRWLTLFLLFCLISALWSEFPFIAFKRWIKVLGHAVMILIVLTDPDPFEAMRTLLKRVGFVLVPLSILLINCYPRWGQGFDPVTGEPSYTGAATDKNALGHLCMIVGIFFFWNVLQAFKIKNRTVRRNELCLSVLLLGLTCWLLKMSSSATSLVTFVVGVLTIGFLGIRFVDKRRVGIYLLAGIFAFAAAESLFGIYDNLVHTLGRNLDLTDRTELWPNLLKLQPNPIFGAGFESFWMGQRLDELWARYSWYPNEAQWISRDLSEPRHYRSRSLCRGNYRNVPQDSPGALESSRGRPVTTGFFLSNFNLQLHGGCFCKPPPRLRGILSDRCGVSNGTTVAAAPTGRDHSQ